MNVESKIIKKSFNLVQGRETKNHFSYLKENEIVWRTGTIIVFISAVICNVLFKQYQMVNVWPYRVFLVIIISVIIVLNILTKFNESIKRKVIYDSKFYCGIGIVIIVWDMLTEKSNILPLPFFPSLAQIFQMIVEDYDTLFISTASSMRLLIIGFLLGTLLGVITGVLVGWYKQCEYWIFPAIKIIGVVPATAWIPIVMFLFPSSFCAQVFLIVLCVWFPVAFMTSSGIKNLPKEYFEAAKTLGADEKFLIFKVAIPGAMPSIFTGIYTATGVSFATLVVSEMIGAKAGLGWYINWAKGWSNYAKVYASIIIMAVVFSIVMAIIFKIRDGVLIWQKGLLK